MGSATSSWLRPNLTPTLERIMPAHPIIDAHLCGQRGTSKALGYPIRSGSQGGILRSQYNNQNKKKVQNTIIYGYLYIDQHGMKWRFFYALIHKKINPIKKNIKNFIRRIVDRSKLIEFRNLVGIDFSVSVKPKIGFQLEGIA